MTRKWEVTQGQRMSTEDYEYRGMIAQAWDLLRGDTSDWGDRTFYRDIIRASGQPALDIGCGTGRLLLDYLTDGIDIDGVDVSTEMLEICRQKAQKLDLHPTLYQQHMEALDLPRSYRTIIVPSSSFQLITHPQDAAEAMQRFWRHLEPQGTLVMPFMIPWDGQTTDSIVAVDWEVIAEQVRPEDGLLIRRWARATYDLAQQLEHTEDRYEAIREGQIIETEHHSRSPASRWYTPAQAIKLYAGAGFITIRILKEFTQEVASPSDPVAKDTVFSVLGQRP
jgi:ubiquinone/menaquinone biosynthesis C-methylase UbiE